MTKVWVYLMLAGSVVALRAQVNVGTGHTIQTGTLAAPLSAAASKTLQEMAAQAGVIFAGHVVSVDWGNGYVETRFRIDQAVRGCPKAGTYLLREWAALWTGEAPRYQVGDRRLMMLYGRGAAGMSSPVNGMDGAIPIVASAVEPIANEKGIAPAEDGSDPSDVSAMAVDLRWVQAAETRATTAVTDAASAGAVTTAWAGPVAALEGASSASANAARPSVATVMLLLGTVSATPVKATVAR